MDTKTKDILLKFDEQGRYETPSKFDYKRLLNRVTDLAKDLESHFRLIFAIDNQVQDASFYGDIKIPQDLVIRPRPEVGYSIRISNFGRLATINFQEEYSDKANLAIKEILRRHDFIFISAEDLDQEYDGQFEEFKKILAGESPTWQIRYFDYMTKNTTHNRLARPPETGGVRHSHHRTYVVVYGG